MAKTVDITPEIEQQIRFSTADPEFDTSGLKVFETILASGEKINKPGSLFHGGVLTTGMLAAMADKVNGEGGSVPLHTLHQPSTELPVGRVFQAALAERESDGKMELRGLFYLPESQQELVQSINNNVIDSVSIGAIAQKVMCSECDFDYRSEDASILNFLDKTCDNGHTIGQNGVHTRLIGLENWMETSLVSQGGVGTAKIVSRSKQKMPSADQERLAASGIAPEAAILTATFEEKAPMADKDSQGGGGGVDLSSVVSQVTDLSAQVATKDAELKATNERLEAANKEIETLKAQIPSEDPVKTALGVTTEEAKTKLGAVDNALTLMQEHATAALTASGAEDTTAPATLSECIDTISKTGLKLHQIVASSNAQPADAGDKTETKLTKASTNAFRRRK